MAAESTLADAQPGIKESVQTTRTFGLAWVWGGIAIVAVGGGVLTELTRQGAATPGGNDSGAFGINLVWMFLAALLTLLALLGFALRAAGAVRRKNALKAMLMHLMAIFFGLLGFFAIGFGVQSGGLGGTGHAAALGGVPQLNNELAIHIGSMAWGVIGARGFTLAGSTDDAAVALLFLFQSALLGLALIVPLGAMLERFRFSASIVYILFAAALLYPIFANWAWGGGWLSQLGAIGLGAGYIDIAGSGVIHAVGGWAALAGVYVLRPRIRKFNMDETANVIPAHNLIYVLTGSMFIMIGWLGVIAGAVITTSGVAVGRIGTAAVVIIMAGAGGAVSALLFSWSVARPPTKSIATKGYPDATMALNGGIAGLVAGSAGCACVSPLSGLIIGVIAGLLLPISLTYLEERFSIDDPVGAITIHGVCGVWGQVAVGIFADGTLTVGGHAVSGLIAGNATQIIAQLIGVAAAFVWGFGGGSLFFNALNRVLRLRVSSRREMHNQGLDVLELGSPAYSLRNDPVHGEWPEIATGGDAYVPDN